MGWITALHVVERRLLPPTYNQITHVCHMPLPAAVVMSAVQTLERGRRISIYRHEI